LKNTMNQRSPAAGITGNSTYEALSRS
jgi:hypothetical protein